MSPHLVSCCCSLTFVLNTKERNKVLQFLDFTPCERFYGHRREKFSVVWDFVFLPLLIWCDNRDVDYQWEGLFPLGFVIKWNERTTRMLFMDFFFFISPYFEIYELWLLRRPFFSLHKSCFFYQFLIDLRLSKYAKMDYLIQLSDA